MNLPTNTFRRAITDRNPRLLGTWLMAGSALMAEAMGFAGFDFIVVDMEHAPIGVPQTLGILQAIAGTPAQPIVRLPWNDFVVVKRVLDLGAQTLMFPYIQNRAEAERAVAATRYPREGIRGVAGMQRASRYGLVTDYLKRANEEICVIAQIETPEALAAMEEIATVPGVDAVFLSPSDLSATRGHIGDLANAELQAALAAAAETCRRLGKPCGIIGPTPESAQRFLDAGYGFVACSSDLSMLMRQANAFLGQLRPESGQALDTGTY